MIAYFLEALEQYADGVRAYETYEDSGDWRVSLHFNSPARKKWLAEKLSQLAEAVSLPVPEINFSEMENKNWVEELAKNFQPIQCAKFYVYSQFSGPSNELIDIKINPGMAFGTGQHETTYLCLEAISFLKDEGFAPENILDLGCGSGILAIAAAKIWNQTVTAADNDPIAVQVACENGFENKVDLECMVSNGFAAFHHYQKQQISGRPNDIKFDLILANILMNPLLEMAEDMAEFASNKVILSGFNTDQTGRIIDKYTELGFTAGRIFVKNHWVALLLSKAP